MKRDIGALADREFDLVIVGGGIYGAATAWEASLRGLSVAIVDKGDFGSGTSFNNLKTIHGGIRYLQHADLKRMRESVRERRHLMRIAPHLVHPLPFLVPTYRGDVKQSRAAMRIALLMNDLVGWDRNRRSDPQKYLPSGRALSREECLRLAPGLHAEGLTGGVLWYDAQMYNSDRLTFSFVSSAAERGAVAANYVEVCGFLRTNGRVAGVLARDVRSGADGLSIRARSVVNAAGPWVDGLLEKLSPGPRPRLFHFSKAINLVTRPVVERVAVGVTSRRPHRDRGAWIERGSRFLCLVPWRHVSLIGTSHAPYSGEPDGLEATDADIGELLEDVNEAYPEAKLRRDDVRLVHRGLLPRVPANGSRVTLVKSYRIQDHRSEGIDGILSIVGVKYTTARDVAEKTVDRVLELLGKPFSPSRSREVPLAGGDIQSFAEFLDQAVREAPHGISAETMRHLAYNYGSRWREILAGGELTPVCEGSPVLRAEIRHAVREEMALDLGSVVLRRTDLGTAGHPGRACLEACADVLQEELGWDRDRRQAEIDAVESFYRQRS